MHEKDMGGRKDLICQSEFPSDVFNNEGCVTIRLYSGLGMFCVFAEYA